MNAAQFTEHGRTIIEVLPRISVGEVTVRGPGDTIDQEADVYLATGLKPAPPPPADAGDIEESSIEVLRIRHDRFSAAVRSGTIRDARSIAAVQMAIG